MVLPITWERLALERDHIRGQAAGSQCIAGLVLLQALNKDAGPNGITESQPFLDKLILLLGRPACYSFFFDATFAAPSEKTYLTVDRYKIEVLN